LHFKWWRLVIDWDLLKHIRLFLNLVSYRLKWLSGADLIAISLSSLFANLVVVLNVFFVRFETTCFDMGGLILNHFDLVRSLVQVGLLLIYNLFNHVVDLLFIDRNHTAFVE
jgi:hypothetical protein